MVVYQLRRIGLLLLFSFILGWLLYISNRTTQAAGCTDIYDENGSSNDTLTNHPVLSAIPGEIKRSLCGFYDADYVEFPVLSGQSYRVRVLQHENPSTYGVNIEVWQPLPAGGHGFITATIQGVVTLNISTAQAGSRIVRIGSAQSDTGAYGGGDYLLAVTLNQPSASTPTATSTATTTPTIPLLPTVTSTTTASRTPRPTPLTSPTATPKPTLASTPGPFYKNYLPIIR